MIIKAPADVYKRDAKLQLKYLFFQLLRTTHGLYIYKLHIYFNI